MRQLTASLNVWLPDKIQDKDDWQIDPLKEWMNDWLIDWEILTAMIIKNQLAWHYDMNDW